MLAKYIYIKRPYRSRTTKIIAKKYTICGVCLRPQTHYTIGPYRFHWRHTRNRHWSSCWASWSDLSRSGTVSWACQKSAHCKRSQRPVGRSPVAQWVSAFFWSYTFFVVLMVHSVLWLCVLCVTFRLQYSTATTTTILDFYRARFLGSPSAVSAESELTHPRSIHYRQTVVC